MEELEEQYREVLQPASSNLDLLSEQLEIDKKRLFEELETYQGQLATGFKLVASLFEKLAR